MRKASSSFSLCGVAALLFAASSFAQAGGAGPFGGSISALRTDPVSSARVYATTSNGFFRSDDNGATWASKETGLLAPHPTNGIFTVTSKGAWIFDDAGNLYRSANAGDSWTATGYTASTTALSGLNSLAQGNTSTVWFAANTSGLLVSNDNGATFGNASGTGFPTGQSIASVVTDPSNPSHVLAGATTTCDGNGVCPIYVSTDGGATWTSSSLSGTLQAPGMTQHLIGAAYTSGLVYALYSDPNFAVCSTDCSYMASVLRSSDNGLTWTAHSFSSAAWPATTIATTSSSASTVWVDSNKSTDGGVTFTALATSGRTTNGVLVPTTSAVAISNTYTTDPRLWVGTQYAGIYSSSNDGTNWTSSNTGMNASDIRSVLVHPADSSVVYAAYGDSIDDPSQALFRSTAGGAWSVANAQLSAYQLRTVLIDPTTATSVSSTTMFAVGNGFDTSGGPFLNSTLYNSGIYKSTDGGSTWATQNGGIPTDLPDGSRGHYAGVLRTIIADPRSCATNTGPTGVVCTSGPLQTLYVTGAGRPKADGTHPYRVMKSTDAGVTWTDSSNGLPNDVVSADSNSCSVDSVAGVTPIVMDPTDSRVLYIGTFSEAYGPSCTESDPVNPTVASGVYKSTDAGATWVWQSTGLRTYDGSVAGSSPGPVAVLDTLSLAIDPTNPRTLWVSTKDINVNSGTPGELYKSTNGASSWSLSNSGVTGPDVRALLADANNPGTVYAASGGVDAADPGGVYKSTDGGTTWKSISVGLPAFSATALTLDPHDSTILYAGTSGGVYSLVQLPDSDGDGVPDSVEDAGANNGDANNDGIKDKFQATVATIPAGLAGTYGWQPGVATANPAAREQQIRVALQSTQSASDFFVQAVASSSGSDCTQTVDMASVDATLLGTDSVAHHGTYTYPDGMIHFELPQCQAADVDIVFTTASFGSGWSWRYYGPSTPGDVSTLGWHDASSLVLSRVGGDWKLHLANGQFGSYRPSVADSILFEGGPAYTDTVFTDSFE